jgi:hypothetical protein
LPYIYGRISCMYLGTEFHRYWARCGRREIHPDDEDYLQRDCSPFNHKLLPCPFDGPLEKAKVVICLSNPSDGYAEDVEYVNGLVSEMRSGEEPLPSIFDTFYKGICKPIRVSMTDLRSKVAVFNVCPYSSRELSDVGIRKSLGLPSVWQAQKYLREVLIPRAQTGNIHLILIRKLSVWGVTEGLEKVGGLHVIRGRARNGLMPEDVGQEISRWLVDKGHITNLNQCEY